MSRQQSRVNECKAREGPEVVGEAGHGKVSPVMQRAGRDKKG